MLATTITTRSTADLAADLAALMAAGGPSDTNTWAIYHDTINALYERHPEVEAAWDAWADANDHLPAQDRVPAASAILPAVNLLFAAEHPALALMRGGTIWPGRYSDIDSAWRAADWSTEHYTGAPFCVIDIRTGEKVRSSRGESNA